MKAKETIDSETPEGPSKSELKREMQARQELGEKLTRLGAAQLDKMPIDATLREAIADYQRFGHREAKRRQLQFIGKLMRSVDVEAVEHAWQLTQAGSDADKKRQHKLEYWRDRLIQEGDEAITAAMEEFTAMERQHIRQLIRDAKREQRDNKPPAASRKIYQYLKSLGG